MSTENPVRALKGTAPDIDTIVGQRIHTLMWEGRVKNKDIAALIGVDASAIGKKLRGDQKFSIEQLRVIADALESSIAYFVGESDIKHPNQPEDPTMD
ncbi:MAG TPA: helix-turn-helix transcriptional regulator [Pseudoclavibacter sp.]|nr:helix-turn-helix transcriptional regulator [Pseudoclavibacter sp.]